VTGAVRWVAGILALAAGACHRGPDGATPRSAGGAIPGDTAAEGVIHVVGADPFAGPVLIASAGRLALAGPLEHELAQLVGARVRVWGPAGGSPLPSARRAMTVRKYDILEVAGARPIVGWLRRAENMFWVDTTRLASPPSALIRAIGAKVWVTGRSSPTGLEVQMYGILVPAAAPDTARH
jgi:hypothetical protein